MKDIKNTNNQRTFRPQIPGRAAMAILGSRRHAKFANISLGNMIMTVEIAEPSILDSTLGWTVSEFDFREEGFCIIRLHGPFIFRWEMCVSEEGHGPVEGILSVTVGGWSATDRFGLEVVKQCMDPRLAPRLAKKRRVSGGSVMHGQRDLVGGRVAGSSKENIRGDVDSRRLQDAGGSASTNRKGMRYTAQDRMERYQRRMGQEPASGSRDDNYLLKQDSNTDEIPLNLAAVHAGHEAQKPPGEL
jgi:hypothetical protein